MFKALLQKQLREMTAFLVRSNKTGKTRTRASAMGVVVMMLMLAAVLMASFGTLAVPLCLLFVPQGLGWLYFAVMGALALLVSVLTSAFLSHSSLFQCKDNDLLLSLPIPPGMIFLSRLCGVYLTGLAYLLLAWLPAEAVYLWYVPHKLAAALCAVPMTLLLAAVSAILSVLLGWAVAAVTTRAHHKSFVTVAASLVFLAVYYAGFMKLQGVLDDLTEAAVQLDVQVRGGIWVLYGAGQAACGSPLALLAMAACVLAVSAVFYKLAARRYLAMITSRRGAAKVEYHARLYRRAGLRQTLLRRELLHLASSSAYMLNGSLGTLMMPLLGAAVLWERSTIREMTTGLPVGAAAAVVCAGVCAAASINLLTASSVSLEGRSLWLIQSLPVTPWQVLHGKLDLHLLLTALPAELCAACALAVIGAEAVEWLLCCGAVLLFTLLAAELGLVFGVMLPNLRWTNETAVVKQGVAATLSIFSGWAVLLALGGLTFLLAQWAGFVPALGGCAALMAVLDALLCRWLQTAGAAKLAAL